MTKEELLKKYDFDLDKASKAWNWMESETSEKFPKIIVDTRNLPKHPVLIMKSGTIIEHVCEKVHLKDIQCIAVPRIDGSWIGIYPKYRRFSMFPEGKSWDSGKEYNREIDAIYNFTEEEAKENSEWLQKNGSEVAAWCRYWGGYVPSLLTVMAVAHFTDEINSIADYIVEANIIDKKDRIVSAVRFNTGYAWIYNGYSGCVNDYYLYISYLAVPCVPFLNFDGTICRG